MPTPPFKKIVLAGTNINVYPGSASGKVRYYIDLLGTGPLSPEAMTAAISQCPRIGETKDFPRGVLGAPTGRIVNGMAFRATTHVMRVAGYSVGSEFTGSGQKHFVDVLYESRPQPIFEYGSNVSQTKTNTYLTASGMRAQMKLDWVAKQGLFSAGLKGVPVSPSTDTPYLKTPVSGTRMEFGASVRISSTWYIDELVNDDILFLNGKYNATINQEPLFFSKVSALDDSRLWLCTGITGVSNDGGYSARITGEFVYSPIGWDTISTYVVPFTDQLAILENDVIAKLYSPLKTNAAIPEPYAPPLGGAGKFPQQVARKHWSLIGFLSQGLLSPQPDIRALEAEN